MPKTQEYNHVKDQHRPLSVPPPKDEYLGEARPRQTLVIEDDSSLLAPSSIKEPQQKETVAPMERPEAMIEVTSTGDTLVSPVTPLLGITPHENTQLQSRNMPEA